ncbi:oxidoreductase [candidate division KSB1 bacterium]|nr:oxidoreductase [candidate division KSB1 bacterium]
MRLLLIVICLSAFILMCAQKKDVTGGVDKVELMVVNPGHFHAGLVQKKMYKQVSPVVHVYAPEGPDVENYLNQIKIYNQREQNPTTWETVTYRGTDYLEQMLAEKPGNVMVTSGKNRNKTRYIKAAVDSGIHVLADKPMCIDKAGFELLKEAFETAEENNILLYDIMTERYQASTILQKELSRNPQVFGELLSGSMEKPAVVKESVHHFYKMVSGSPIRRPVWYFDVDQQGEGIVDVTTHLVDLIQWECFPNEIIDYQSDIEMLSARHWPTEITRAEFIKVTRQPDFPDFLQKNIENGVLNVFCNGEMHYKIKDIHAKVSVIWRYEAPEGAGDTHYSIMCGTKSDLIIRQGDEQGYRPELYVEPVVEMTDRELESVIEAALENLSSPYPDLGYQKTEKGVQILIPDNYRIGHEAHFAQVTEKYLKFLKQGALPDWEVPNMLAKYYTTTSALEMARTD